MEFTVFEHVQDTIGTRCALTWDRLVGYLSRPRVWSQKNGQLIGPVFNGTKSKAAFSSMGFGVVDIDGPTHEGEEIQKLYGFLHRLDALGIGYVVASSYSHGFLAPHLCKVHVFLRLAHSLTDARHWHHVFDWLQQYSEGMLDPKLRDEHMAVFLPCIAQGVSPDRRILWVREGVGLDVDWVLSQPVARPEKQNNTANILIGNFTTADVVTDADLKDLSKTLKRSKNPEDQAHGRLLARALEGQAIAKPGERHDTLVRLAFRIAKKFPYADALEVAQHFRVSLAQMAADGDRNGKLNPEGFAEKIKTAQVKRLQDLAENRGQWDDLQAQKEELKKARIQDCFARVGKKRDKPYTDKEIKEMAAQRGLTVEQAHRRWVVHFGGSYYFYVDGEYTKPMPKDGAAIAARIHMEPVPVTLEVQNASGTSRPMSLPEITDRYGVVANGIEADLTISQSFFDEKRQIMHEAVSPMRTDLRPKFHPHVDQWLRHLGGKHYEKLCDWLATAFDLVRPTCALFLYGKKHTGKSLLAAGVAAAWRSTHFTELDDVMGSFNDKLADNPIVFGDEYVPQDRQGDPDTVFLRRFVQERNRSYKRKYLPTANLKGAARLILAANSPEILVGRKWLYDTDIEAINERILCIRTDAAAARYITAYPIAPDEIAQHALALSMYRVVERGSRFLVEGEPGSELEVLLRTGSGLRSEVCRFVSEFLKFPGKSGQRPVQERPVVHVLKGTPELILTPTIMHALWEQYCPGDHRPKVGAIAKALGALSKRTSTKVGGKVRNVRVVDMDMVAAWNEIVGDLTRDEIAERLLFFSQHGMPS